MQVKNVCSAVQVADALPFSHGGVPSHWPLRRTPSVTSASASVRPRRRSASVPLYASSAALEQLGRPALRRTAGAGRRRSGGGHTWSAWRTRAHGGCLGERALNYLMALGS